MLSALTGYRSTRQRQRQRQSMIRRRGSLSSSEGNGGNKVHRYLTSLVLSMLALSAAATGAGAGAAGAAAQRHGNSRSARSGSVASVKRASSSVEKEKGRAWVRRYRGSTTSFAAGADDTTRFRFHLPRIGSTRQPVSLCQRSLTAGEACSRGACSVLSGQRPHATRMSACLSTDLGGRT